MTFFRTLTTATALLLALSLSPAAAGMYSTALPCTTEQETAFAAVNVRPDKCSVQLIQFESCDDDCLAASQSIAAAAPNCTIQGEGQIEHATFKLRQCEGFRLMPSNRYIPKVIPGLRNCTLEDKEAWKNATGARSGFANCNQFALSQSFCSPECLVSIESTIKAAPPCVGWDGYSLSESGKSTLVACIKANRGSLQGNTVLQSVATSDGAPKTSAASVSSVTTVAVVAAVTSVFALVF